MFLEASVMHIGKSNGFWLEDFLTEKSNTNLEQKGNITVILALRVLIDSVVW